MHKTGGLIGRVFSPSPLKRAYPMLIYFLSISFLVLGGLGQKLVGIERAAVLFGVLMLVFAWYRNRKIEFPKSIIIYSIFLLFFLFQSFSLSVDSKKSLEYLVLFLTGGLFWLIFYNVRKEKSIQLDKIIILLGIIFGGLAAHTRYLGLETIKNWSLYTPSSVFRNHNHIGDLWALVFLVIIYHLLKSPKKIILWPLIPLGFYFLLISQSRAALLSLAAGIAYLAINHGWVKKFKRLLLLFTIFMALVFLYFGSQKSVLLSRPYYAQAVLGFIHSPQGVGVGNFGALSSNPENHILGLSGFSYFAHNLILEILTGLGILGFTFVYWLYKVFFDLMKMRNGPGVLYVALFLALFTNFLLDITYTIPTMLWLWFMLLGLAQTPQEASRTIS